MFNEQDIVAVNTLRALSVDQIEKANSGHPGLPLGAAPMAYALWAKHLKANPKQSDWIDRDRFVLSAGHGSALLYALLHVAGYDVTLEDLKDFRQMNSRTPGHPEYGWTDGVEATTGPLGQGVAQAVGMAMAEKHLAATHNTDDYSVIDHYTYALVGDGDLMEGISYEAMSYAGKMALDKLIILYDSNDISLDGDLDMSFTEDIEGRFKSQNWHYLRVEDGNDLNAISNAIEEAKAETGKPTMIEIKTVIGYGSPGQGTSSVHGAPLGQDAWTQTKEYYGYDAEAFTVPEESAALFQEKMTERGATLYDEWLAMYEKYQADHPEKAKALESAFAGELPEDYDADLTYVDTNADTIASRVASNKAIQALSKNIPFLWGGSADLSSSNNTMINDAEDFMPDNYAGRNIWFGVREFAMAGMMNGIMLHGGSKVYGGTFFVFTDYLKGAVRLSALSHLPVTYVMTHDSVAVGEDGPTHEPISQLAAFRALPNLNTIRPADENETYAAWKVAMKSTDRPTMLVLSRQGLPVLEGTQTLAEEGVKKGAYVLSPSQADTPEGILIATGSEVALAVETQAKLKEDGIDVSVVSMPAMNRFEEQSEDYKESVLPSAVRNRISLEMASTFGWERYVGLDGVALGIDRFGKSGPGDQVIESFGFTADNVSKIYKDAFN